MINVIFQDKRRNLQNFTGVELQVNDGYTYFKPSTQDFICDGNLTGACWFRNGQDRRISRIKHGIYYQLTSINAFEFIIRMFVSGAQKMEIRLKNVVEEFTPDISALCDFAGIVIAMLTGLIDRPDLRLECISHEPPDDIYRRKEKEIVRQTYNTTWFDNGAGPDGVVHIDYKIRDLRNMTGAMLSSGILAVLFSFESWNGRFAVSVRYDDYNNFYMFRCFDGYEYRGKNMIILANELNDGSSVSIFNCYAEFGIKLSYNLTLLSAKDITNGGMFG